MYWLRRLAVAICIASVPALGNAEPPSQPLNRFERAKEIARNKVYAGRHTEEYCGCDWIPRGASGGTLNADRCGYQVKSDAVSGSRIEWEHVMPAAFFGRNRSCWSGHPACVSSQGRPFKGRTCCQKVDAEFQRIESDLHNLIPAVGELNGNRSDLPYGEVPGEPRAYGRCNFEIGGLPKVAEPPDEIRGPVARVWFYMSDTYGIEIPAATRGTLERWDQDDPIPREWEILRDQLIEAIQGNSNNFIRRPKS